MKLFIPKACIGMAVSILASIACSSPTQKVENAKTDLKEARIELSESQRDSVADYNDFMAEANQSIADNERMIAEYKTIMQTSNKAIRAENQKQVDFLSQQNIDMRKKIEDYKANGNSDWNTFKKEFKYDMGKLSDAIKNIGVKNNK